MQIFAKDLAPRRSSASLLLFVMYWGIAPTHRLALAIKRSQSGKFSVLNWIEKHKLSDRVSFHPYYHACNDFPVKKIECACWIDDSTLESDLNASVLLETRRTAAAAEDRPVRDQLPPSKA